MAHVAWAIVTMAILVILVNVLFWRPLVAGRNGSRTNSRQRNRLEVQPSSMSFPSSSSPRQAWAMPGARFWPNLVRGHGSADRVGRWWRHLNQTPSVGRRLLGCRPGRSCLRAIPPRLCHQRLRLRNIHPSRSDRIPHNVESCRPGVVGIIWVPIGIKIRLNPRLSRIAQPMVQIFASFRPTSCFPSSQRSWWRRESASTGAQSFS